MRKIILFPAEHIEKLKKIRKKTQKNIGFVSKIEENGLWPTVKSAV